jgi:hypothetical protein
MAAMPFPHLESFTKSMTELTGSKRWVSDLAKSIEKQSCRGIAKTDTLPCGATPTKRMNDSGHLAALDYTNVHQEGF